MVKPTTIGLHTFKAVGVSPYSFNRAQKNKAKEWGYYITSNGNHYLTSDGNELKVIV